MKNLVPNWDIFLTDAYVLFSEGTPAFIHREFFGFDGAYRAGPPLKQIDRYVFDQALGLFLCAPQTLYAVNKHVTFRPYRSTFELADTEVDAQHWSRRSKDTALTPKKPL
jgi:peptide/nickel transport system substrate-binding protein